MNSWLTKMLWLSLGVIFLLKGGLAMMVSLWRFTLPLLFIGGGVYFFRKYLAQAQLKKSPDADRLRKNGDGVIEICSHCLQEMGSCPKCKKA